MELGTEAGPASQAGIFVSLESLVGAILGVFILHEMTALAAGALIIGAAAYLSIKPERSAGAEQMEFVCGANSGRCETTNEKG
jgi:drug/metabolite transporter (DMT)-like permease